MKYYCGICWNEVNLDGYAFYCPNDNHIMNDREINWLDGCIVFDTKKADFVVHYDEPAYQKRLIE